MTQKISISPVPHPVSGRIRPPGSKSITNRALICAAIAQGDSVLRGALDSEDTQVMIAALQQLGIDVQVDLARQQLQVSGCGGSIPKTEADLYIANSGTTVRFLAAMLCLGQGNYRLDGSERMRQRPIADLIAALQTLGANLRSEPATGCPPVVIQAAGLAGGTAKVRGDISSQFLSGLLMATPYSKNGVELQVEGELVSKPYVEMTLRVMRSFGIEVQAEDLNSFSIPPQQCYQGCDYEIEPDASAASYFWATAAITGGKVTVEGLSRNSLQGDVDFCDCLQQMGCQVDYQSNSVTVTGRKLRGIEVDMNAISDTVQTLGAVALFAEGPTTIRGVAHIRHKETDRIGDLATELRKLGAEVEEFADGLRIVPGQHHGAEIHTYNDHRMAMSLALAGLRIPGVVICDPQCTEKTYPNYFQDLALLCQNNQ